MISTHQEHLDQIAASARGPWSADAFDCEKCPKDGCPAWWKEQWLRTDSQGLTERIVNEGCGFRLAQGMFVRALAGSEILQATVSQHSKEILSNQEKTKEGLMATLKGILMLAAKASGNPAAVAAAPMIPRVLKAAKKLLPRKKES